jgi:hypothetical protein
LREEHRVRVFENRGVRGKFGRNRDKVKGEWRKLHNEKLNPLAPELFFLNFCTPCI